jgi:hypothetical protein
MRSFAAFLIALMALAPLPVAAQAIVYQIITEEIVQVPVTGSERFVEAHPQVVAVEPAIPAGIAAYGPFRVLDGTRAALVDVTDERSPGQFTAMMHAYPGIKIIEMVECPGTEDDRANLRLGKMIHARGIATHVPQGGSVRSGAVELFLAGAQRIADPGAEFAVHSWADEFGLEPKDYGANAPENLLYIDYYRKMGMTEAQARAFYAMTNSVPNADAKWLTAEEMGRWVPLESAANRKPNIAMRLDSGPVLH